MFTPSALVRARRVALASTVLLVGLAGAGCRCTVEPEPEGWRPLYEAWAWPEAVPPYVLVDQSGTPFSLDRYDDDWVLMSFVFTRCHVAEACPMTMSKLVATQEAWRAAQARGETDGRSLALLALTLDPAHDDPEALAAFGARYGADPALFTLATGPEPLLAEALPSMFSVLALPDAEEGIRHSVKVVLLGPGRRFEAEWKDDDFEPDEALARILSEHAPSTERGD